MQDRPTVDELLEAVQEFLERDVMPAEGRVGFHGRVASNVLGIVRRELRSGAALDEAQQARLAELLGREVTDVRQANAELAEAIRAGQMDERRAEVLGHLRATAEEKLSIDNPRALEED